MMLVNVLKKRIGEIVSKKGDRKDIDSMLMSAASERLVSKLLDRLCSREDLPILNKLMEVAPYKNELRELTLQGSSTDLSGRMRIMRFALEQYPSLADSDVLWISTSIEELVVACIDGMHRSWRLAKRELLDAPDYTEHFGHLPLAFLNWGTIQKRYYQLAKRLFRTLEIELNDEAVNQAYRLYEAYEFYQLGLRLSFKYPLEINLENVLKGILEREKRLQKSEQTYLSDASRVAQTKLEEQIAERGCGSLKKMIAYATAFDLLRVKLSKNNLAEVLRLLDEAMDDSSFETTICDPEWWFWLRDSNTLESLLQSLEQKNGGEVAAT